MPGASKEQASETVAVEGYEGHLSDLGDGYTVAFETYTADADLSPFFEGLPNNQCQADHWGYVIKGKVTFKTSDGEETNETGDAYHMAPGHTPVLFAGTEIVEFSPTKPLQEVIAVVSRNMEAASG